MEISDRDRVRISQLSQSAHVFELSNQWETVIEIICQIVEICPALSKSNRELLTVGYKNLIKKQRDGIKTLKQIIEIEKAKEKPDRVAKLEEHIEVNATHIRDTCLELIQLVDRKLIPASTEPENIAFYTIIEGDFYRYICETSGNEAEFTARAQASYEKTRKLLKKAKIMNSLTLLNELNYSVFYYDILGQKTEAIEIAQKALDDSALFVNTDNDDYFLRMQTIQSIKDNITSWTRYDDV